MEVTAVIVDNSMHSSKQEREAIKRNQAADRDLLLLEIADLFSDLDENGDGVFFFQIRT